MEKVSFDMDKLSKFSKLQLHNYLDKSIMQYGHDGSKQIKFINLFLFYLQLIF